MADKPIAFFITWTVYGTHLQGDPVGWRRRREGFQPPQPRLVAWRRERLKHAVLLLDEPHQSTVKHEIHRHCDHRGWHLWIADARTNHVHVVVTGTECSGKTVRDQLKANCTRGLRQRWPKYRDRPVWTSGGDWKCVQSEEDLAVVIQYVSEAQDRMEFKRR